MSHEFLALKLWVLLVKLGEFWDNFIELFSVIEVDFSILVLSKQKLFCIAELHLKDCCQVSMIVGEVNGLMLTNCDVGANHFIVNGARGNNSLLRRSSGIWSSEVVSSSLAVSWQESDGF